MTEITKFEIDIARTSLHWGSRLPLTRSESAIIPAIIGAGRTSGTQASDRATSFAGRRPNLSPTLFRRFMISRGRAGATSAVSLGSCRRRIRLHPTLVGIMFPVCYTVGIDNRPDINNPAQQKRPEQDATYEHQNAFSDFSVVHLSYADDEQRQYRCQER